MNNTEFAQYVLKKAERIEDCLRQSDPPNIADALEAAGVLAIAAENALIEEDRT